MSKKELEQEAIFDFILRVTDKLGVTAVEFTDNHYLLSHPDGDLHLEPDFIKFGTPREKTAILRRLKELTKLPN